MADRRPSAYPAAIRTSERPSSRKLAAAEPSPTVLVVDDRPENCDLYREYLTHMGFRVVDADNGATAIQRALAEQPDVIVMDLAMPTMDGLQATRLLKKDAATRKIPIVVVTASGIEQHSQAQQAGCDAFLVKPCALDDLEGVLRSCVMLARSQ